MQQAMPYSNSVINYACLCVCVCVMAAKEDELLNILGEKDVAPVGEWFKLLLQQRFNVSELFSCWLPDGCSHFSIIVYHSISPFILYLYFIIFIYIIIIYIYIMYYN